MSRKREGSLSKDWQKLTKQLLKPKLQPKVPEELPLGQIRMWPNVFQHRRPGGYEGPSHVRKLAAAIDQRRARMLDPVTVWWDGRAWACVDGHHRLSAYAVAEVGTENPVPVKVFEGTLAEAMGHAAAANSKDKLSMSSAEKSDAAWRMVAVTAMSKAEAAKAAGVSESTVANMRKVRGQLEARESASVDALTAVGGPDYRDLRWAEAKRFAMGVGADDFDRETHNEAQAQEMALALRRALGKEGAKYPEILARALEIYDSRLMDRMVEWWTESDDEPEEETERETA